MEWIIGAIVAVAVFLFIVEAQDRVRARRAKAARDHYRRPRLPEEWNYSRLDRLDGLPRRGDRSSLEDEG